METYNIQENTSLAGQQQSAGPEYYVIIVVGCLIASLVMMSAILLLKYVCRRIRKRQEQRVEEAMTRAIDIYNSQEPLEEPEFVFMKPGDQRAKRYVKCGSEIAFVHSDGRIDRFRPLMYTHNKTRESKTAKKQDIHKSSAKQNYTQNQQALDNEEPYVLFQPLCVNSSSFSAQNPGADFDAVSCDMPPSYEEALELPIADVVAAGSIHDLEYYNVEIGKKGRRENVRTQRTEGDGAISAYRTADRHS